MKSKALLGLGVMLLVCVTVAFAAVNVKGAIINALSGFQYNGAAPSGHTLCGNGTAYVDCVPAVGASLSFNGTGTPAILKSSNIASVVRTVGGNASGDYTVTFTTAMSSASYVAAVSCIDSSPLSTTVAGATLFTSYNGGTDPTTTSFRVISNEGGGYVNCPRIDVAIFQ